MTSLAVPPVVATLLALGASWHATLELFCHFRVQYVFALLPVLTYQLWARAYRLALPVATAIAVNCGWLVPLFVAEPSTVRCPSKPLTAVVANVLHTGGEPDRVAAFIAKHDPDVMALLEVDSRWLERLGAVLDAYPHRVERPRADDFGIAVYSRVPFVDTEVLRFPPLLLPTISVRLESGLTVVATHPLPPSTVSNSVARNRQLLGIAARAAKTDGPLMVLGDLNTTPFSPSFFEVLRQGRLRDSARGYGFSPTWPVSFPPLWIPIDHALYSDRVEILDRRVGEDLGSDHYPLVVEFRHERGP
ncbi:MAG: endonuclease/exonuclease/phosphatase family protein [Myxococcota bacterium]